jgi:hypothetical protein
MGKYVKSLPARLLIISCLIILIGLEPLSWAEPPAINIDLTIGKNGNKYDCSDSIPVTITVRNDSGKDILISQGFKSEPYHMAMRVIDPSGSLLIPTAHRKHNKIHRDQPLPFVYDKVQERFFRVAPCEVFKATKPEVEQKIDDLRQFYQMELSGRYSVQVQLSAMVFTGPICDEQNYLWQGLLKSEVKYFYLKGQTKVRIKPNCWKIVWWKNPPSKKDVVVQIFPELGKEPRDYQKGPIFFNNLKTDKIERVGDTLEAYFNIKDCIENSGRVSVGESYPVTIKGRMSKGRFFCGNQWITIID